MSMDPVCGSGDLTGCSSCLDDVDDEVRDRAAFYLKTLEDEPLALAYVKEGEFQSLRCSSWADNEQSPYFHWLRLSQSLSPISRMKRHMLSPSISHPSLGSASDKQPKSQLVCPCLHEK